MIDISKQELESYLSLYGIPEHLALRILPLLHFKELKRNEVLVNPGEICSQGYLIVGGGLILSHVNPTSGAEKVVNFFLPTVQPYCAVWDSYFTGIRTQCKLFAFKNSLIGIIDKSEMEDTITADADLLNYYLNKLNETLVFENNLRVKLITSTPEEFYGYLRSEYPSVIKRVPTKYIAEFMGISREWLSKIKRTKFNN